MPHVSLKTVCDSQDSVPCSDNVLVTCSAEESAITGKNPRSEHEKTQADQSFVVLIDKAPGKSLNKNRRLSDCLIGHDFTSVSLVPLIDGNQISTPKPNSPFELYQKAETARPSNQEYLSGIRLTDRSLESAQSRTSFRNDPQARETCSPTQSINCTSTLSASRAACLLPNSTNFSSASSKVGVWHIDDTYIAESPVSAVSITSTIPRPTELDMSTEGTDSHTVVRNGNSRDIYENIQAHRGHLLDRTIMSDVTSQTQSSSEYVIPVRLTSIQRKIYRSVLLDYAPSIEAFCRDPSQPDPSKQVSRLREILLQITTHPLMVADTLPELSMSEDDEAWYLIESSSKFEVIAELLECLRPHDLRVAIFCDDEQLATLWRIVLKGLKVRYTENDLSHEEKSTQDGSVGDLHVLLLPTTVSVVEDGPLDLVFSLGEAGHMPQAPLMRLVANNSAEHVAMQITDTLTIVSTLAKLGETVGACIQDTGEIVQRIIDFLCGQPLELDGLHELTFPSSQYELLPYSVPIENGLSKETQEADIEGSSRPDQVTSIVITEVDGLEVHTEMPEHAFRQTLLTRLDKKHETDTTRAFADTTEVYSMHPQEIVDRGDTAIQAQFISPSNLEVTPTQPYEAVKSEIWAKPTADQEQVATLEEDIERMMLRFDNLREKCRVLAEQRDEALAQAASTQKRFERVLEEARNSRNDKNELKSELDRLRLPALPEETSPDYRKVENIRLKTELDKAKKSSESKLQDFEFVRQQYQQSSNAAAELATENSELRAELELAKNQLQGGLGYKLAVSQAAAVQDSLREEAENLSLRNNVLIEQLRRMRDERVVGRGRGDGRRDLAVQDRKRAASASADNGQRKKIEKLAPSRLSVASLMSPLPGPSWSTSGASQPEILNSDQAPLQMARGQSHDPRLQIRDRTIKRHRTPF